jgi:hypothetical protein
VDEKMIKPKDKKTEQSDERIIDAAKKGDVRIYSLRMAGQRARAPLPGPACASLTEALPQTGAD